MTISEEAKSIWSDFLNPNVMRRRFATAGLFIAAHEMLESAIKDPLLEFYSNSWTATEGWKIGPKYRSEVLALDPKGKFDALRGSTAWLLQSGAIDDSDVQIMREIKDTRNIFAHELSAVLSGQRSLDFDVLFPKLVSIIIKIERWWIVNVDLEIDQDLAAQVTDPDEIMPGTWAMLHVMELVALGEEDKAWEFYNAFQRETGQNA